MRRARGLTMIELLISLAIGSFVVVGAVFVYSQTRTTYAINEQVARLQENGRYVLAVIEPDIQLAGNYGSTNDAGNIMWDATQDSILNIKPSTTAITGPAAIHTCGNNFALYLLMPVQGSNNSYGLGCAVAAAAGAAISTSDTLTIRRAETEPATASTAHIQVYKNQFVNTPQKVFWSATAPGDTVHLNNEIYNLTFRSYYVAANSSMRAGLPTLWRKVLGTNGGQPAVLDEEIMPGVEDFQVEFGVDDGDHDGNGTLDYDDLEPTNVPDWSNGVVSQWLQPNSTRILPHPAGRSWQIVAVRVWIRLRSDTPEQSFTDTKNYSYAGVNYTPAGAAQNYRRLLVSRTIYVRSARVF